MPTKHQVDYSKFDGLSTETLEELCKNAQRTLAKRHREVKLSRAIEPFDSTKQRYSELVERFGEPEKVAASVEQGSILEHTLIKKTEESPKEMVHHVRPSPLTSPATGPIPIIPVLTHGTEEFFVDKGDISYVKHSRGVSYQTGPLVVGKAINLYGLSQANDFIAAGDLDIASTVSPDASLSAIYINVRGSVLRYDISGWDETAGVAMVAGSERGLNFLFRTDRFIIGESSRDVYGVAPDWVRQLHLADLAISLRVNFSGSLQTTRGTVEFGTGKVEVLTVDVFNTSTSEKLKSVVGSLFDDISIVGYELDATFTN
ncbi:hypothetical protein PHABIO_274 [Pseudomonas phage Phabio]|uniref:Uncharacterized protein n=1 Tax=Pseudomonas phage Phabio TaxID=2006668 RepID=A0A1Y0SWN0_9CAUD|nr:major head protein [Pseudomonas phage Phabio]ARV76905.1 hypothetical protein PHABIO_274 [Pseudomonas phage Phabio]